MHNNTIQALKIYLKVTASADSALGIYGNEIRLSEEPLSGIDDTWTSGLIALNGIGDIKEGADLSRGGSVANFDGLTVQLIHTNQYILKLKDLGVFLNGCKCEIYEFIGTELDSDSVSSTVTFSGVVDDITWNEVDLGIPIKSSRYMRDANMSKPLAAESTEIIPLTFGSLCPPDTKDINVLAKFLRSKNIQDDSIYTNVYFTGTYPDTKIFPVFTVYGTTGTQIGIATRGNTSIYEAPDDCYLFVVDGYGKGQIRRVVSFAADDPGLSASIIVTVDSVFLDTPSFTDSDTAKPRSWVQFFKIQRNFVNDFWPCKSFLKAEDGSTTATPEIYDYQSDKFNRIADYGFSISTTDNNALNIQGEQCSDYIDKVDSFIALPMTSLSLENTTHLEQWNCNGIDFSAYRFDEYITPVNVVKLLDGIYRGPFVDPNQVITTVSLSNTEYSIDKKSTTYATFSPTFSDPTTTGPTYVHYLKVLKFGLPVIPKGLEIDGIYLGLKF